jgi:hypothetical protein
MRGEKFCYGCLGGPTMRALREHIIIAKPRPSAEDDIMVYTPPIFQKLRQIGMSRLAQENWERTQHALMRFHGLTDEPIHITPRVDLVSMFGGVR